MERRLVEETTKGVLNAGQRPAPMLKVILTILALVGSWWFAFALIPPPWGWLVMAAAVFVVIRFASKGNSGGDAGTPCVVPYAGGLGDDLGPHGPPSDAAGKTHSAGPDIDLGTPGTIDLDATFDGDLDGGSDGGGDGGD